MTHDDVDDFHSLITACLAFYGKSASDFTLSVWWEACKPFDMEQVSKALTAHAVDPERGRFAPMPADLVRELHGTQTDRSLIAWGRVLEAMSSQGAYSSADFGDPAIHAAITDLGGWPAICRAPVSENQHLQRRFCEMYRAYARRGAPDAPRLLHGAHALANAALGYDSPDEQPPLLPEPTKRLTH